MTLHHPSDGLPPPAYGRSADNSASGSQLLASGMTVAFGVQCSRAALKPLGKTEAHTDLEAPP